MISALDLYHVLTAVVPLYVAMILAYSSVKWWKIFTPEQCSGISRFVAFFAIPFLAFHYISSNNLYDMNFKFIVADSLQKLIVLCILFVWSKASSRGSLEWSITLFALSTLPNTVVMGIPLLVSMYGDVAGRLMVQLVVFQFMIWYTVMSFLYEFRSARILIAEKFPERAGSIISFELDYDVASLDEKESLQMEAENREDDKIHVTIKKSTSTRSDIFSQRSHDLNSRVSLTPQLLNLCNTEIYSLQSSRNPTPGSSFNHTDFQSTGGGGGGSGGVYGKDLDIHVLERGSYRNELHGTSDQNETGEEVTDAKPSAMPPTSVITRLILITVWRKLIRNPNTYACLIGLIWSLVSFRWNVAMPAIVASSISIVSNVSLGMAMFSLGLFMALQPKIIACGNSIAALSMVVRFLIGPTVMAAASAIVGLRGVLWRVAIVQAALPPGIVSSVFAREYNVHSDILSTGVIFGMFLALPITLVYYILLGL